MAKEFINTFIVDCPTCRAKVAAFEIGAVVNPGIVHEGDSYYGAHIALGKCPRCSSVLVGESQQTAIGGFDAEDDEWSDFIRVYPKPAKSFLSNRIPSSVKHSLGEADKCIQVNANTAACVMLGRALEGLCRNLLEPANATPPAPLQPPASKRPLMLGQGIDELRKKGLIDERLHDWSKQLQAYRNLAAHPTDEVITREDAEDLQSFVYAIIEYVYDLTDRYNEFKRRVDKELKIAAASDMPTPE